MGLRQMRAGVGDEMLRERWRHAGDGRPAARADDSLECAADSSMLSEVARPHLHQDQGHPSHICTGTDQVEPSSIAVDALSLVYMDHGVSTVRHAQPCHS